MERERRLLDPAVRARPDVVRGLLHPDFFEYGQSGRVWDLASIVDVRWRGSSSIDDAVMVDPQTLRLSADTILLTFRIVGTHGAFAPLVRVGARGRWGVAGALPPGHPDPRSVGRTMTFRGWTDEAVAFFEGLEAENTKAYWTARRSTYDEQVAAPMLDLLADLAPERGAAKIFRPYRDTRFSKDKSPYKTTIAATLEKGGYVQFSADGLGAGAGAFHLSSGQLERYRRAVDDDASGAALETIAVNLERHGCSLIGHDLFKTAPRGYAKDHPRLDLLRRKGITAWQMFPAADWLRSDRAPQVLLRFFQETQPLEDWLAVHVGDAD